MTHVHVPSLQIHAPSAQRTALANGIGYWHWLLTKIKVLIATAFVTPHLHLGRK
jgi:hypothetical protein